jgi:hypothetical protein
MKLMLLSRTTRVEDEWMFRFVNEKSLRQRRKSHRANSGGSDPAGERLDALGAADEPDHDEYAEAEQHDLQHM